MKLNSIGLFLMVFTLNIAASAAPNPQMSEYFSKQLTSIQQQISLFPAADSNPEFKPGNFEIFVIPTASFGINQVLTLSVSPELDLMVMPTEN